MIKRLNITLCIFLIALLAGPAAAQKIKTENGIQIIENGKKPKPPKGAATRLVLEEEIAIGGGDDPEKAFAEVSFFVVDDEGSVFAVDSKDQRVKAFDKDGGFLTEIGKPGDGPGEVNMPLGIQLTSAGELVIEDVLNRRLSYFTPGGEFLRSVSLAKMGLGLLNIMIDAQGGLMGREMGVEGDKMFFKITKFNAELEPLFTLDKIDFQPPIPGSGVKLNIMDLIAIYALDREGNIYYSSNKEYEIQVYSSEGRHIRSIRKQHKPVKLSEADQEEMLDRMPNMAGPVNLREVFEFPDTFSPFQSFTLDEEGRLHVRTWEKGKAAGEYINDIFDAEGRYISRFTTKSDLRVWKGGRVYAIEENEDGFKLIKRYRVIWEK